MEALLLDMELDLLGSWDLTQLLASAPDVLISEQARGLVLPGLSAGPWSLVDPCGPSPVDEVPQDSLWLDPTDVVSGSPELFSGLQQDEFSPQYKKLSSGFLFDDDYQTLPFTSDLLLASNHISSPPSTSGTSPIDVKFEFGDVHSDDQALDYLTDTLPRVIDNVYAQNAFPQFELSTPFSPGIQSQEFVLGPYEADQILIDSYEGESSPPLVDSYERRNIQRVVDFAVPTSPYTESCPSPLDSLEYDDDDSLHDAENVCQLLMSLDGGDLHGAGLLSHVSPEEVESVLSRDSSSDDLVALCDASMALYERSVACSEGSGLSMELDFAASSSGSHRSDVRACQPVARNSTFSSASSIQIARSSTFRGASSVPVSCGTTFSTSLAPVSRGSSLSGSSSQPVSQSSIVSSGFIGSYSTANPALPAVVASEYHGASLSNKSDPSRSAAKSRAGPYEEVQTERRVRKKEQNKTAALRYRQKKREEKGHTMTEVEELEHQNQVLRNRANDLSKEISYLRGLLEEIKR